MQKNLGNYHWYWDFFLKKDRLCYCFNKKVEGKDESDFMHLFQIAVKSIAWAYFQT